MTIIRGAGKAFCAGYDLDMKRNVPMPFFEAEGEQLVHSAAHRAPNQISSRGFSRRLARLVRLTGARVVLARKQARESSSGLKLYLKL